MSNPQFPYGNDPRHPERWAGLANARSRSWMIGYDSGTSIIIGGHTFLMFGRENLMAAVVSFVGAGLTLSRGVGDKRGRNNRSGGSSTRETPDTNPMSRIDDAKSINDARELYTAGDDLKSAVEIYRKLAAQQSAFNALKPFSLNDLGMTFGIVSGAGVDAAIATATYYIADARNLFTDVHVGNLKMGSTNVSAGIGTMAGFWRVKKSFSLWNELYDSATEEYPFRSYNVHPYFREWKSQNYAYQQRLRRVQAQDRLTNAVGRDMIANPGKYGLADEQAARVRWLEMLDEYQDNGRSPKHNPFLPWVPRNQQHIFY